MRWWWNWRDTQDLKSCTTDTLRVQIPFTALIKLINKGECLWTTTMYHYGLLDRVVVDSVCPKGWHVPSKAEWEILIDKTEGNLSRLLSDEENLFEKNDLLTKIYGPERNVCGFSVLYAGYVQGPEVMSIFNTADFWTHTADSPLYVNETLFHSSVDIGLDHGPISLRCLKD